MKVLSTALLWIALSWVAIAADPGRDAIATVKVRVYHGTNGDPSVAGEKAAAVADETVKWLASKESLKFDHYRLLGSDAEPLFRSYENWAQPIEGSDEILCRFEVASRLSAESVRIDLELWLSRKKILKSGVVLTSGKPVVVLGPEWRGGRVIVAVELAPTENKGQ